MFKSMCTIELSTFYDDPNQQEVPYYDDLLQYYSSSMTSVKNYGRWVVECDLGMLLGLNFKEPH
jgi:hypothetical protein